jgi:hypothetical protein
MGCIDVCNEYIAVDECIELCSSDVKKKTTDEWKNRQQLFPASRGVPFRFAHRMHLSTLRSQFLHDAAARSFTKSHSVSSSLRCIRLSRSSIRLFMHVCAEAA